MTETAPYPGIVLQYNNNGIVSEYRQGSNTISSNSTSALIANEDLQRVKEKEEDEMYNERYRKECEDAKRKEEERIMNEKLKREMFLKDNLNYIERDRNKRLKERNEDLNYEYRDNICCHDPEEMGKCMKCQKVFLINTITEYILHISLGKNIAISY